MRKTLIIAFLLNTIYSCEKNNVITQFYDNGKVKQTYSLQQGKIDGKEVMFFESGDTMLIANWSNGLRNGLYREFYPKYKLKLQASYEFGKNIDSSVFWYETGTIKKIIVHDSSFIREYYANGNIHYEGGFGPDKMPNGLIKFWYLSGQLKHTEEWSEGVENGEFNYYYENGVLKETAYFKNGKRHGKDEFYDENGILIELQFFIEGERIASFSGKEITDSIMQVIKSSQ